MRKTALAATLILAALPFAALAMDEHAAVQPGALKWSAGPPGLPPGAQFAVLAGDPSKQGAYVLRAKMPAGYKVPPHTHPTDENVTVISGTFHIGMGDKFDAKKGETVKAAGFVHVGKDMQHYAWVSAPTVIQVHGMGPFEIKYINPADDPRNASAKKNSAQKKN
jgi:quercetin dioxygenase-like cupin family protein